MNLRNLVALVLITAGTAGVAPAVAATSSDAPAAATVAPASEARVSVTYANPQTFSEAREFGQQDSFAGTDYLKLLKEHLIKRATKILPPDDRLDVTITDIQLAGAYEPWHGPDFRYVRFMKDVYPPRIDLTFKLLDSDGKVLREGSRKLRNLGYLQSGLARPNDTDALRYDKALIDSWLRKGPEKL